MNELEYREFCDSVDQDLLEDYYYHGLCSEVGEVADFRKRQIRGDKLPRRNHLLLELGDVLWYLDRIAKSKDYTLSQIMEANIKKLKERYKKE